MRCHFVVPMVVALAAAAAAAGGGEYNVGGLQIREPWARATPKGAEVAAGYMTIVNAGTQPDRLIGGSTTAAGRFEIHEMAIKEGVMQMRPMAGGLEIKPGMTVELKPGGLHAMWLDLKRPLAAGERVRGSLIFERGGQVEIEYQIQPIGGAPQGHSGHRR